MTSISLYSALEGIHSGLGLSEAKRVEDSVIAGRNAYFGAVFQFFQAEKAMSVCGKALEAASRGAIPLSARCVAYVGIPLVALLSKSGIQNVTARRVVNFMQQHIGNLCHVIAAVSSIVMIYFGHVTFGVVSLVVLSMGLLSRTGFVPEKVRQVVHLSSFPVLIGTSIVCGDLLDKIYAVASLGILAMDFFRPKKVEGDAKIRAVKEGGLSPQQLEALLAGNAKWVVNRGYVHVEAMPPIPNIKIQEIGKAFEEIDWKIHVGALRKKLSKDERYQELYGDPTLKTDAELIQYIRRGLKVFLDSVVDREILAGEPRDYELLESYLKIIADYLKRETNLLAKADALLHLAVEGEYCGPGKFEVVESIYAGIVEEIPNLPFGLKVRIKLEKDRNTKVQAVYAEAMGLQKREMGKYAAIHKMIDLQDNHTYNIFLSLVADGLGVRKGGADNDTLTIVCPFQRMIIAKLTGGEVTRKFWEFHDPVEVMQESIGTKAWPRHLFYGWWKEWVERQDLSQEQKQDLIDEMSLFCSLYGVKMECADRKIDPRFIRAMLYDMSILKEFQGS